MNMESVPGAVATGFLMIEEDRDLVVITPGTDLIDKDRPNPVVTTFT